MGHSSSGFFGDATLNPEHILYHPFFLCSAGSTAKNKKRK
jgi:hypothetical protein